MAERTWSVGQIIHVITAHLKDRGCDCARLDAELLVGQVLQKDRTYLYIHDAQLLSDDELVALRAFTKRRARHEPMAYILGEREFFGHTLKVGPGVLIPRPETEHLVEAVLAYVAERSLKNPRIIDIGTGSGAIAIALAHALPDATLIATEISEQAAKIAQENIDAHKLEQRITLVQADLFAAKSTDKHAPQLAGLFDVIVSNPPYIADHERDSLPPDVRDHEPAQALFGGALGLDVVQRIIAHLPHVRSPSSLVALEVGHAQADQVITALRSTWPYHATLNDLAGHRRVVLAWQGLPFSGKVMPIWDREPAFIKPVMGADATAAVEASLQPEDISFDTNSAPKTVARRI